MPSSLYDPGSHTRERIIADDASREISHPANISARRGAPNDDAIVKRDSFKTHFSPRLKGIVAGAKRRRATLRRDIIHLITTDVIKHNNLGTRREIKFLLLAQYYFSDCLKIRAIFTAKEIC